MAKAYPFSPEFRMCSEFRGLGLNCTAHSIDSNALRTRFHFSTIVLPR
jgi:hypothetical protein